MGRMVSITHLGLCEHCGVLLNFSDAPAEAVKLGWKCPSCDGVLSHKSFGYEKGPGDKFVQVRWVGPGLQWVDKLPSRIFELEGLLVSPLQPSSY